MFEPNAGNLHEACVLPEPPEDELVRYLLDRISIQEDEIRRLQRLEETVHANIHIFEALLKKNQEGILLVTPEMVFLRMIHSAFGHSDGEVVGQSVLLFMHPDDRDRVHEVFEGVASGRASSGTCQCRVRDQNGEWVWMVIDMTDLLDDPLVQAIVFNSRAVTPAAPLPDQSEP